MLIGYLQMIETPEDQRIFEQLYLKYREIMYYAAYNVLNNVEDAEDAVHNTFAKIAANMKIIKNPADSSIAGFMVLLARNSAIDLYRMKKRRHMFSTDIPLQPKISYTGENMITYAMTQLPVSYQTVLILKHLYGYSTRETAKLMGLTESNVIKIDQRAKKKLREICKKENVFL